MEVILLRVETVGDVTVAHIGGNIGKRLGADVGLAELVAGGIKKLVLDTGEMTAVRSWFLGQLVDVHRKARAAGCEFRICCPAPELRTVLEITKLNHLIRMSPTLDEALAGF